VFEVNNQPGGLIMLKIITYNKLQDLLYKHFGFTNTYKDKGVILDFINDNKDAIVKILGDDD
jgi:hypothetical protein